jgi:hypothetical protein
MDTKSQRLYEEAYDNLTNSLDFLGLDAALNNINLGQLENFVMKRKALLKSEIVNVFKENYVYSETGDPVEFNSDFFEYTLNVKAKDTIEFTKLFIKNSTAADLLKFHKILFESNVIRPAAE